MPVPSVLLSTLAATRPRVCVVGAGAGGLVAAKVLREVADVTVFESESAVGGVWRSGAPVLYSGLVTNLPKQIMAFRDTPFPPSPPGTQSFVTAAAVSEYLESYARQHGLMGCIRLGCPVDSVRRAPGSAEGHHKWRVRAGGSDVCEEFDAVVVCNGHYNLPAFADLPGAAAFPNRIIHSYEYDVPAPFTHQVSAFPAHPPSPALSAFPSPYSRFPLSSHLLHRRYFASALARAGPTSRARSPKRVAFAR